MYVIRNGDRLWSATTLPNRFAPAWKRYKTPGWRPFTFAKHSEAELIAIQVQRDDPRLLVEIVG